MSPHGRKLVYIVDDDPGVRRAVGRLVRSAGYETRAFASAEEALEHGLHAPDLVCLVLDIRLPGMSGLDLFRRLEETGPRVPCILVSGHVEPDQVARQIPTTALAFLAKPFEDQALLDALERAASPRTVGPGRR